MVYSVMQSLFESTFIAALLFFWLMLMHSIASQDNLITIQVERFFMPKIAICLSIFVYLAIMRIFIYVKMAQDPFFDLVEERQMSIFYQGLYSSGVFLFIAYIIYFGMIEYQAWATIKQLKKTYRFSLAITVITMAVSSALMLRNGQVSQRMDVTLFLSLYSLFNFYVYLIAYLYAPAPIMGIKGSREAGGRSHEDLESDRERQQIMNEFYETELNEMNEDSVDNELGMDDSLSAIKTSGEKSYAPVGQSSSSPQKQTQNRRRDMKKAPTEKAKDKLWDKIVADAMNTKDDSDSDDEKI
mmetsp:Transcript_16109/g.27220  ORF Transcript_16109/g.27220 Transcript_16109/m.27220 type:complete len:299 (+) Transcript_16109:1033-1929(+)